MPHELPKSYEPGAIEARWAEYWVKEKLFSVPTPPEGDMRPVFTLLLPPPNVTGRLHMGHMLNQTQMDIIVRWHRMRRFVTLWLPGTDHAGIATQMMVERQLASQGKKRAELGREKFVERVWEWKRHYGGAILEQMKRLGVSVDWGREYFTMDENLSRAVREVFVRLHEEGLIYRGRYIVNWCPRCETAISDLEVKHEEIPGKLWEIRYPVVRTDEFITVATTRPETMLGDTAVAVNERDERYQHLHGQRVLLPLMNREIPIITDELAQPEFGTGAVKVTPAHDPNDFEAGLRHNLPQIEVMDQHARMNENAGAYVGLDRHAARKRVLEDLRAQGFLVGEKDYTISIGKCDRCGTVVEPRLSMQWFIRIKPLADKAIEVVADGEITIVPENYKQIYLNWMRNIHDWCISRQLWWGHRIPAWHCTCGEIIVARTEPPECPKCGEEKLKQDTDVLDTWFSSGLLPFTTLGWPDKTRDQEVFYPTTLLITAYEILFFWVARMIMFGCHFMPAHQQDPALKKASGWGDKKNDSVPFRQVYIHALVRDAERQKMSKTRGNVLDPIEVIEKYGTDATRFTLAAMSSPGTDIAFNQNRTEGYRAFANKIWNAARFMFMNVDRIDASLRPAGTRVDGPHASVAGFQAVTLEDHWIVSRFNGVARSVNDSLAAYRFDEAANSIYDFFWGEFCDWYIELIKPRLQKIERLAGREQWMSPLKEHHERASSLRQEVGEETLANLHELEEEEFASLQRVVGKPLFPARVSDKAIDNLEKRMRSENLADWQESIVACTNLVSLFEASLRLLHPVMPFITEEIWHAIYDGKPPQKSLAFASYPEWDEKQIDKVAETQMEILQDLIVSVRNLRAELKVETKTKVPIEIYTNEPEIRALIEQNRGALEHDRQANVQEIHFAEASLAKLPGARHAARFDVRLVYEQQVDLGAEREKLTKDLEKLEKEKLNIERQLANEQLLSKAPAHVVEKLRSRLEEVKALIAKLRQRLAELE